MKTFLLELKIIPATIIFTFLHGDSRTGPKWLQIVGFRWAPCTLSSDFGMLTNRPHGMAECTQGLTTDQEFDVVLFEPIQLGDSEVHPNGVFIIDVITGGFYVVAPGLANSQVTRGRWLLFNALLVTIADRRPLEGISETPAALVRAVALHVADDACQAPASENAGLNVKPLICQYLFRVALRYCGLAEKRADGSLGASEDRTGQGSCSARGIHYHAPHRDMTQWYAKFIRGTSCRC